MSGIIALYSTSIYGMSSVCLEIPIDMVNGFTKNSMDRQLPPICTE